MPHCKPSRTPRLSQLRAPKLQRTFPKQSFPHFELETCSPFSGPFGLSRLFKTPCAIRKKPPGSLSSPAM